MRVSYSIDDERHIKGEVALNESQAFEWQNAPEDERHALIREIVEDDARTRTDYVLSRRVDFCVYEGDEPDEGE